MRFISNSKLSNWRSPILRYFKLCTIVCFTILIIHGCSGSDDGPQRLIFNDLRAVVVGSISCQTSENGFVYEVELEEEISVGENKMLKRIGITNLPEGMKTENTRISIDVRQAEFPDGVCTANFSPDFFFEATKVQEISN